MNGGQIIERRRVSRREMDKALLDVRSEIEIDMARRAGGHFWALLRDGKPATIRMHFEDREPDPAEWPPSHGRAPFFYIHMAIDLTWPD